MPKNTPAPEPEQTPVRYEVRSKITGAHACGPYDDEADARRECKRLNQEAASGQTAHQQPDMPDGRLNIRPRPVRQEEQPMLYEIVTTGGIALAEGV